MRRGFRAITYRHLETSSKWDRIRHRRSSNLKTGFDKSDVEEKFLRAGDLWKSRLAANVGRCCNLDQGKRYKQPKALFIAFGDDSSDLTVQFYLMQAAAKLDVLLAAKVRPMIFLV